MRMFNLLDGAKGETMAIYVIYYSNMRGGRYKTCTVCEEAEPAYNCFNSQSNLN